MVKKKKKNHFDGAPSVTWNYRTLTRFCAAGSGGRAGHTNQEEEAELPGRVREQRAAVESSLAGGGCWEEADGAPWTAPTTLARLGPHALKSCCCRLRRCPVFRKVTSLAPPRASLVLLVHCAPRTPRLKGHFPQFRTVAATAGTSERDSAVLTFLTRNCGVTRTSTYLQLRK